MRTRIDGGWVVAYAGGRHALLRDGVVVYEDGRIIHVGKHFDGAVDQTLGARDKLVCPGFIDTHVHTGHRASHRLISDAGRPPYFGQPFLEISVPREGSVVQGDPRYLSHGAQDPELDLNAAFTVAELLRNGVTTFVEFGSQLSVQQSLLAAVERMGIRAYLAPGYDCGRWVGTRDGRLKRVRDERAGRDGLAVALDFVGEHDGACDGRVRGILVPREVETCSLKVLRDTARAAREGGLPIATHAAYSVLEFHDVVRERRMTPVEVLDRVGLLGPRLNIGHGNFIAGNPNLNYAGGRDLALMGEHNVSVSHCPINIVRRGRTLSRWASYLDAGVNLCIGSDTYPRDMVMNMRTASYLGKVMGGDYFEAGAGEVFEAATLGGARSLGRDDLGRLAPGARADIVIIDLHGRGSLRFGPVRDPIKSLVECGVGDDVETVIVDGVVRMRDGVIPGVDLAALREQAQRAAERIWGAFPGWDPLGRSAEEACPWSYPLLG